VTLERVQTILTLATTIAGLIGLLVFLGFAVWQFRLFLRYNRITEAIRAKNAEIDAVDGDMTARTTGHLVTEDQRVAQVNKLRVPLERELVLLKEDREVVKDLMLFAKK
jgi:hypothetical protein